MMRHSFQNFQVDHMTLLLQPPLYNVAYIFFNVIFGVGPDDILYEKRREWQPGSGTESMTFAACLGQGANTDPELNKTIIAVVQPSEPLTQPSHVREMLDSHESAAHWQHIALRTSDLIAFHKFAVERGVQFITPILREDSDDLIQVFSGEWYYPGAKPSGMFFEFLQRNPPAEAVREIQKVNQQTWFIDKTFLGLYDEKEREYQTKNVTPFIRFELMEILIREFGRKKLWEINSDDLARAEQIMLEETRKALRG